MDPDDIALSEVHVGRDYTSDGATPATSQYPVVVTRFSYDLPTDDSGESVQPDLASGVVHKDGDVSGVDVQHHQDTEYASKQGSPDGSENHPGAPAHDADHTLDEDGDILVRREEANASPWDVITIEHALGTRLTDVGLQVWQGCLLLCDYMLDNPAIFEGKVVLELGGGVGLATIISATAAKTVICTDIGDEVLSVCQRNVSRNSHVYSQPAQRDSQMSNIIVREMDWTASDLSEGSPFGWSSEDKALLKNADILIAADVIYDEDLTDALFATIHQLMSDHPAKVCFVSLEKRLNFTLEDRDVASPPYTHFMRCLSKLSRSRWKEKVYYTYEQVPSDTFKQFFHYDRSRYLELWRIDSFFEER